MSNRTYQQCRKATSFALFRQVSLFSFSRPLYCASALRTHWHRELLAQEACSWSWSIHCGCVDGVRSIYSGWKEPVMSLLLSGMH